MKPMKVTPESMAADGQELGRVAQEMGSGLNQLQSTIQGDGNPWGADEQGSIFAGLYQAVLGKAFESIVSHVEQVDYAGQALVEQASGYSGVESGMTKDLGTMQGQVG